MVTEKDLAKKLLEVVPPLMRQIRVEVRAAAQTDKLTVPQFRILLHIHRGFCQVGKLAEQHGIPQPAMSKMIDGLVKRGLVARTPHATDRRHVMLEMTAGGDQLFRHVQSTTQSQLCLQLKGLSKDERVRLHDALAQIESIFADDPEGLFGTQKERIL